MVHLSTCDSPLSLGDLATRIRNSSNFRFEWQFYQYLNADPATPINIRQVLESIIANPELHQFLRDSFDPMYSDSFEIEPLHEHCQIRETDNFENIMAQAAGDHLGAYSQKLRKATADEKYALKELFNAIGEYHAFELLPGSDSSCPTCRDHNNHLFSNWFFGVAWDWCFFVLWPQRRLLWLGCLTDTD